MTLADGIKTNYCIKLLDISDNKIDDKGFSHFSEIPLKNYSLEALDVSKNQITVNIYYIYIYILGCISKRFCG
jgi:hypothetical protein